MAQDPYNREVGNVKPEDLLGSTDPSVGNIQGAINDLKEQIEEANTNSEKLND